MIKVLYLYMAKSPINLFLERQIQQSLLEHQADIESIERIAIEENPDLYDFYNVTTWHTMIFEDQDRNILYRIDNAFCYIDIENALEIAREKMRG